MRWIATDSQAKFRSHSRNGCVRSSGSAGASPGARRSRPNRKGSKAPNRLRSWPFCFSNGRNLRRHDFIPPTRAGRITQVAATKYTPDARPGVRSHAKLWLLRERGDGGWGLVRGALEPHNYLWAEKFQARLATSAADTATLCALLGATIAELTSVRPG
jgi:hypothetical protein